MHPSPRTTAESGGPGVAPNKLGTELAEGRGEKASEAQAALRLEELQPPVRLPSAIAPCPIQEAVIELRFERLKTLIWDAVPGLVLAHLQGQGWETLERLPIAEVPQELLEMETNLQHAPHYSLSKGPCLLLLGPKMLGLANRVTYLGWHDLFAEFRTIFETLRPVLIRQLNRIGIRYIDTFKGNILPNTKLDFRVAGCSPALSTISFHLPLEGRDGFTLNLRVANGLFTQEEAEIRSIIDLDASVYPRSGDEVLELIESGHLQQKQLFFSLLKDEFLESLNPTY